MSRCILRGKLGGIVVALVFFLASAYGAARGDGAPLPIEPLEILTSTGAHRLSVEVASTPDQRQRGLMFRSELAQDSGMLFDFETERAVAMWMKNTPLPLDMIFVSRAGRVVSLALGAEPYSERVISSGAPALAVLEVNAGTAKRFAIAVGDVVRHPIFGR